MGGQHVLFETGIRRLSKESGFFYRYSGTGRTCWKRSTRPPSGPDAGHSPRLYVSPRVIDHYLEGSVVAYHAEHLDEIIAAEQGDLTDGEKALLDLLKKELRRDLRKAA